MPNLETDHTNDRLVLKDTYRTVPLDMFLLQADLRDINTAAQAQEVIHHFLGPENATIVRGRRGYEVIVRDASVIYPDGNSLKNTDASKGIAWSSLKWGTFNHG